jgi:ABC-2 type transport system permease protein
MEHNNKNEHNYELENDLNANQPINQPNNQTSNQSGNQSGNKTSSPPLPLFKKDNAVKRILFQIKKEISLLKTDKINLFIAIVLPPLIIILFAAMVINANPPAPVRVAVVDYDSNTYLNPQDLIETNYSNLSVDYIAILNSSTNHSLDMTLSHYYNGSENYNAMMEARALLREKMIDVIVVIPADFTELVQAGMPAIVDIIPDTSDVLNVQRYMNVIFESLEVLTVTNNMTGNFEVQINYEYAVPGEYNAEYVYSITLVLGFVIFGVTCVLTILVVVQEQPIARLLLTPVRKVEILTAKYITYTGLLFIQIILIYAASKSMGLYIRGRVIDLFIALFLMGYVGLSLGMFISTVSETKMEANQLFFVFLIVIVLLSGIFIPLDAMPPYLRFIANLLPLSHGTPMIGLIVNKGARLAGMHVTYLVIQALAYTILSYLVFLRKRYEV